MGGSLELMCLIYCVQSAVGDLVDSSETVISCCLRCLLILTLRPACVLLILFIIICCAVIIYFVELNDFAVDVVAVDVHWFSVMCVRTRRLYAA